MTVPYTRETLDQMTCDNPACKESHGALFFHGRCHPRAPTWVSYQDGVMTVACAECDEVVAVVAVAVTENGTAGPDVRPQP